MHDQQASVFDSLFSKQQFHFREDCRTQKCPIALIEIFKMRVGNTEAFRYLLTDLSKVFDCANHELLKAKFHDYDLDYPYLKLLQSYLDQPKKMRFHDSFSSLQ